MSKWRMRRSVMITPGHRPERLAKAVGLAADSLIFDLEDAVPPARKAEARAVVARAVNELSFGKRERAIRLNAIGSADFIADMAALPWAQIDAVMLPKVERAADLQKLDAALDAAAPERDIAVIATLETPRGILNALQIADASPRLAAFFLGPGDYTMQTGGRITPRVLEFPRQMLVAAAGAVGAQALDAPYLTDLRDVTATRQDAEAARELGFSGKVVFHPDQIAPVNEAFTPSAEEVAKAKRYIAAFREAAAKGENLAYVDGTFIAMDLVPNMERIVALAEAASQAASAKADQEARYPPSTCISDPVI